MFPTTTVMHRLDIATFGLMMALNKPAHRHLSKQFERRDTAKTYHVIVFDECSKTLEKSAYPLFVTGQTAQNKWSNMNGGKSAITLASA